MQLLWLPYFLIGLLGPVLALLPLLFHPRGRRRLSERYGLWGIDSQVTATWFHGASVGEVRGLLPIIKEFHAANPEKKILLTATTDTGLKQGEEVADIVKLLPFDNPLWLSLALRNITAERFIFGETELWPFLLRRLSRQNVPIFMINAVISDFSNRTYQILRPIVSKLLQSFSGIAASTARSKERLVQLGANSDQIIVSGNAKYDMSPGITGNEERVKLKAEYVSDERPVVVLGSLRKGEELTWFKELSTCSGLNVIVAPRQLDELAYFQNALDESGLSKNTGVNTHLLDRMGVLEQLYSFADLAFIGGTLVEGYGGHNPLEAAAYSTPLCFGPHTENITEIVEELKACDGYLPIESTEDLKRALEMVQTGSNELTEQGRRGHTVWEIFSGATARILEVVQ